MTIAFPLDERVLILKVSQRDKAALHQLYVQLSPQLYGVALRLLRRRNLAQHMIQHVFLSLWHAADQYDVSCGSVSTWLSTITRNRCIDQLRQQPVATEGTDEIPLEACAGFDPQQATLSAEDIHILTECLAALNEQQRCAVLLAYFDGSTPQQVAGQMQAPLANSKTWIRSGLDVLKNCMGADLMYQPPVGKQHDTLNLIAAQFVLGVLTGSARKRVKARMLYENSLYDLVHAWERRLNPLAGMVAAEPVPIEVWQAIIRQIELADPLKPVGTTPAWRENTDDGCLLPVPADTRYRRWKTWAGFSSAVAIALALFIVFDPNSIVPIVHLPSSQTIAQPVQDIAVLSNLNKDPAWIVRHQQGQLLLVSLDAGTVPDQHDLELWAVEGSRPPRSLGILDIHDGQATLPAIRAYQPARHSVLEISLEPSGGSPTGTPTGEILYRGSIV